MADSESRTIDIFVRDRAGAPIPGAEIKFLGDGAPAGQVSNAEGRARIELPNREIAVEVLVRVNQTTQSAKLSPKQDSFTFVFDTLVNPGTGGFMERHLALIVGVFLFLVAIGLAFKFSTPTSLQSRIIIGAFSLGGGAIATEISGMIKVDLNLGTKLVIGATGALAIFVILYLVLPA
jgi:hypothetical protein